MRTLSRYRALEFEEATEDFEGSWAVSYGDMITLLLSFFILFFNVNRNSVSSHSQAILQAIVVDHLQKGLTVVSSKTSEAKTVKQLLNEQISTTLGVKVTTQASKTIVEFKDLSFFDSGKTDLTQAGKNALSQFSKVFMPYAGKYRIFIKAFTDLKPVRKGVKGRLFKNNMELSVLRAVATAGELERSGLSLNQMVPAGFGEMGKVKSVEFPTKSLKGSLEKKANQKNLDTMRTVTIILEPI